MAFDSGYWTLPQISYCFRPQIADLSQRCVVRRHCCAAAVGGAYRVLAHQHQHFPQTVMYSLSQFFWHACEPRLILSDDCRVCMTTISSSTAAACHHRDCLAVTVHCSSSPCYSRRGYCAQVACLRTRACAALTRPPPSQLLEVASSSESSTISPPVKSRLSPPASS